MARQLSAFDTIKDYDNFVLSYTIGNKGQVAAILLFNKMNGEFSYMASDGIPLSRQLKSDNEQIYNFLQNIQWYDPTLKVTAHYKMRNFPNSTFYEIKRDWEAVGLPILNPIGLLNLDDDISINTLEPNDRTTSVDSNLDIYNTSDSKDGIARNGDFNTMTIGVSDQTHNVFLVKSNIRKLADPKGKTVQSITYDQAVNILKNNKQSFILATPSNISNTGEWQKIFPNQLAEADEAIVTESSLVYLEQSPLAKQEYLEPYFLFRGYATLTNKQKINFIAAVSAISQEDKKTVSHNPFRFSLIPEAYAFVGDTSNPIGQIGQQKQGAFEPSLFPTVTPYPSPDFTRCLPKKEDLNPQFTQPSANGDVGYGWSPIAVINGKIQMSRKGWWYFVPSENTTVDTLRNDLNAILIAIQQYTGQQMNFRNFTGVVPNILTDFQATGTACPIRVTGDSPTIFIYAPQGEKISIQPPSIITYAEPLLDNNMWKVESNGDGTFYVDGKLKKNLYYEYSSTSFERPAKGWVVKQHELTPFVYETLSPILKINQLESQKLVFELTHAASRIDSDTLFIGPVNTEELNDKLPLAISPRPDVYRFMFYVGKGYGEQVEAPHVESIKRSEYMIVELGSYAER